MTCFSSLSEVSTGPVALLKSLNQCVKCYVPTRARYQKKLKILFWKKIQRMEKGFFQAGTPKHFWLLLQSSPASPWKAPSLSRLLLKLNGVGPVDNRPSTDQLQHFVQQEKFTFFSKIVLTLGPVMRFRKIVIQSIL